MFMSNCELRFYPLFYFVFTLIKKVNFDKNDHGSSIYIEDVVFSYF